jgi:hypothetical protein
VRLAISPHKKYVCRETSKIGNQMETTKITQHEKEFTSEDMEHAVSV